MAKNLDVAYDVVETAAEDFLHDNYIDFSYYTITSRALTRVDGLKPVQRRIIYYMYKAGITSNKGTVKTQRVAGNITGNYHPHGDCLRFNTLFPLSNGEYKKIGEMYEETLKNPNKTYEVYSIDKNGEIKLSTLSNVRIGQKTKEIYKIHLSSEEIIECTNNHPFMILNGDFVKAEDLEEGLVLTSAKKLNHEIFRHTSLQFENKKYINEFDLNKVQNLIDKNNLIYITKIEIEHLEEEEPMYDFTVEGYENALIYFPNTESLICAHNSSVAESMANLAQKHNMRIPLILAEGNVGEFTGDKAAAPRYWEAKLSKEAELLVEEIKDGAAPLVPTFDDENVEPLVLPVKWPTAIINGTEGIAVGYASKMFPHNPTEVMDACIAFVRDRDFDYKDVMKYIKGPDFPTGGTIIGTDGIEKYMETGSGTFIVRGTYKIEPLSRGRNQIVFTELPYKISSMQIIEDIRKRQKDGEFKEISEVKELSDVNGSNLSITVKSGGNVEKVLEDLFKRTRLESRMSTNNTVLIDNRPYVASMPEMIKDFLNHRESCILNRTEHGLINLRNNEMRLAGMLKVLVDIDKTIEIVRSSRNRNSARNKLKKEFKINDEQANVILNMSLGRLTKSDSVEIEKQREEILKKIEEYEDLIENKDSLHDVMEKELKEIKNIIKDDRRTVIIDKTVKELKEDQKERQKVMKLVSANSPVKIAVYNDNSIQMILDENIPTDARDIIDTNSKDTLVGVTKNGKFVEVLVHSVSIENPDHSFKDLIGFAKASPKKDNKGLFFATNKGNVSIVKGNLKAADEGIKLDEGEEIIFAKNISNEEYKKELVIMISENSKIIKFPVSNINGFNQGAGSVIGMNTKGENVIFASTLTEDVNILAENSESQILVSTEEVPEQKRGGQGVKLVNTKKKEEGPKSAKIYNDTDIQVSKRGSAWKKK